MPVLNEKRNDAFTGEPEIYTGQGWVTDWASLKATAALPIMTRDVFGTTDPLVIDEAHAISPSTANDILKANKHYLKWEMLATIKTYKSLDLEDGVRIRDKDTNIAYTWDRNGVQADMLPGDFLAAAPSATGFWRMDVAAVVVRPPDVYTNGEPNVIGSPRTFVVPDGYVASIVAPAVPLAQDGDTITIAPKDTPAFAITDLATFITAITDNTNVTFIGKTDEIAALASTSTHVSLNGSANGFGPASGQVEDVTYTLSAPSNVPANDRYLSLTAPWNGYIIKTSLTLSGRGPNEYIVSPLKSYTAIASNGRVFIHEVDKTVSIPTSDDLVIKSTAPDDAHPTALVWVNTSIERWAVYNRGLVTDAWGAIEGYVFDAPISGLSSGGLVTAIQMPSKVWAADKWYLLNTFGTDTTINLTSVAGVNGQRMLFRKSDTSANTVTITGTTSITLASQHEEVEFYYAGAWVAVPKASTSLAPEAPAVVYNLTAGTNFASANSWTNMFSGLSLEIGDVIEVEFWGGGRIRSVDFVWDGTNSNRYRHANSFYYILDISGAAPNHIVRAQVVYEDGNVQGYRRLRVTR